FGVSSDVKEVVGFAVLGFETIHGRVGTLSGCTGARYPVVFGTITPGANYLELTQTVTVGSSASRGNGFWEGPLAAVEAFMEQAVRDGTFPGAALVVKQRDSLLLTQSFGRLTYDPDSRNADIDTLYDLASVTKVVATT